MSEETNKDYWTKNSDRLFGIAPSLNLSLNDTLLENAKKDREKLLEQMTGSSAASIYSNQFLGTPSVATRLNLGNQFGTAASLETQKSELAEKDKKIKELSLKVTEISADKEKEGGLKREQIKQLEDEKNNAESARDELVKRLQLQEDYVNKKEQIASAVEALNAPKETFKIERDTLYKRVSFFNTIGSISILLAGISFLIYLCNIIPNSYSLNTVSIGAYLMLAFPVVVPIIVAVIMYAQSANYNKEVGKLNEQIVQIERINTHLNASLEINRESLDKIVDKTEGILAKVLDHVLKIDCHDNIKSGTDEQDMSPKNLADVLIKVADAARKLTK
jgi:hypothetical protein